MKTQKLFAYGYFIASSIKIDFLAKFNRSRFAAFWIVLHPLAQVAIFAFILSAVMSSKLPGINNTYAYAIYLISGMSCWSLFSEIATKSATVFIENGNIIKKLPFPKIALILNIAGLAILNNIILLVCSTIILMLLGHWYATSIIWLPIIVILNIFFAIGVGTIIGTLNVFARDVGQLFSMGMQFLFWLTPIVYMPQIIPEKYLWIIKLNPMYYIVSIYHDILALCKTPEINTVAVAFLSTIIIFGIGLFVLSKAEPDMADAL